MSITNLLAENIIDVGYESVSAKAIEMTKMSTLDSLACFLAGSSSVGMKELNELVEEWGGKKESTIAVFGGRVPSLNAALVNGSMGRALDIDDTHDLAGLHPEVPVVAASFATAELAGGVSGKDFITAVTLGVDLSCRMSVASPITMLQGYGWDYSCIYGFFGATAASSKILRLDEGKLLNAIGIAYHQSSGTTHQLFQGYTTKAMGSGFAARGGIVSTLMARKGLTGSNESLEGGRGMYSLFLRGECDRELLTKDLGKTFMIESDSLKPYPCCRCIHPSIDATLALVEENDIKPEDVESVIAYCGQGAYDRPGAKAKPTNSTAAQFSTAWVLATAIMFHKVEIKHFAEEALKNEKVHQLARKVTMQLEPQLTRKEIEPSIVEIRTGKGVYSKRVNHALGSPENPLNVVDKFRTCASYAAKPIRKENLDQVVEMVMGLEDMTDVGQIVRLLV